MRRSIRFAILCLFPFVVACSKGDPSFDTLSSDRVPRPLFNGQTLKALDISNRNTAISISGECDPRIADILIKLPGEASNFSKLSGANLTTAASVTCSTQCQSDGKGCFSFQLSNLKTLNGNVDPYQGQIFEIEVRGLTAGGISLSSIIKLTYVGSSKNRILITSGATESGALPRLQLNQNSEIKGEIRVYNRMLNLPASPNPQNHYATDNPANPTIKARFGIAVKDE